MKCTCPWLIATRKTLFWLSTDFTHVTDLGQSPGTLYTELILWLFAHGVMPLYTPLGGSWLNMAESIQRMLIRRGLAGQNPETPEQIIARLEAVARGWNNDPTPFEWGGVRAVRLERICSRRHALGGSGACAHRSLRLKLNLIQKWHSSCQPTL
jgi:hypothetical protein